IQIYQSPRGIFINQAKYAQEILKKHGMTSCDSIGTPMAIKHLDADLSGTPVDQIKYRRKVGALMYLTASRPDIMHTRCYCARYQAQPTEKRLTTVKRIFWYLKDTIHMGLWYPKDTGFELTAFLDSDHAGCLDSLKSTSGGIQFLSGNKLVSWSSKKQDCTSMSFAEADEDGNPARANAKQALGSLKIYDSEVKSSSSASTSTQNIAFVSSQNIDSTIEPVSIVMAMLTVRARRFLQRTRRNLRANRPTSMGFDMSKVECYNCYRKGHFARECRSPKDTRRNVPVEPQRKNVPVETSTSNTLVLQCDDVGSYDWSFQAEEEPTNYALMAFTSSSSFNSYNEVASCSKACTKAYATLQSHCDKLTNDLRKSQFDVISYKTGLESVEARILFYQQNETIFKEDMKLLILDVQLRDNALATNDSLPASPIYDRYQSGEGYHDVPPPYTGTFMPLKPDLVFHDAPNVNETVHTAFNVELSTTKPEKDLSHTHRPSAPIIEDWVSDLEDDSEPVEHSIPAANLKTTIPNPKTHGHSKNKKACFGCKSLTHLIKDCDYYENKMAQTLTRNHAQRGNHPHDARMTHSNPQRHVVPTAVLTKSKLVPLTAARPVTTTVPQPHVTRPRPAKTIVTKPHPPPRRNINRRPSPNPSTFPQKVTTAKVSHINAVNGVQGNWGNPQHALKDKGVIDSGCSRHMTGNMSYLSDFKEINGGYVTFGGNPKGRKILGFMRPFGCLVTVLNTLDPLGKFDGKANEGFLIGYSISSSGPTWLFEIDTLTKSMNYQPVTPGNQSNPSTGIQEQFNAEKLKFEGRKSESGVYVSLSKSAKTKKHDDKTKRETKGKSHVELSTGYRNLSAEFEDFSNNSINEVNAASTPVPIVEQISTNNTNTFSADGPSNNVVSPTLKESSYVDPSQYPNYLNMSFLEDITYSDDEEDVGAEAEFTNLETTITVSPIITTRVHKDHPVTQINGFEDPDYPDKVYKVVKALYGLHQAPRACLQVKQKQDGIFISHDKYVAEILRKFGLTYGKSASTPIDTEKPLLKDLDGEDVDVHTYRSMIGSLMYLSSSRSDIMFAVCLVRNVDSSLKFYMYLRFLQLMRRAQVGDFSSHTTKYLSLALTQKVFANMRRVRKGFSDVETPLFEGMLEPQQAPADVDEVVADDVSTADEDASKRGGIIAKIHADEDAILEEVDAEKDAKVVEKNADVHGRLEESQAKVYHIDLKHADKVLSMQDDVEEPAELQEVIEVVTTAKLMTKVVTAATTTIAATTPITAATITAAPSTARRIKGKSKEQLEEEESRALKRQRESLEEKAAKKEKLDEEVEELKKHLQIVPNDDDDVYTEATPLALKTYCCWCKLMLLDDAADIKLRLLEQSADVDEKMKRYD
nr:ribonuclease H-like domain-containing protein [Tanacetum cinerariifolium]